MTSFQIAGQEISPGQSKRVELVMAPLYDFTPTMIPVQVIRGKQDGPTLFITAAIHGDEINGVDIIRRLLSHKRLKSIRGTLITVPIVNVFGFNDKMRYLPDRRDLNRCFPGSEDGSLAHQLAHLLMQEVITKCSHGIDLHTGAIHRTNLPQIRAAMDDAEVTQMAKAFGAPVMINSDLRDGSLREAAREHGVKTILYEAGEALRFNEKASRIGIRGILRVMETIGMLANKQEMTIKQPSFEAKSSHWLRAPNSGILQVKKKLGDRVHGGELMGVVSDPFATHRYEIRAQRDGVIIGMSNLPLFNKGDAVFHVATFEDTRTLDKLMDHQETQPGAQADTYIL